MCTSGVTPSFTETGFCSYCMDLSSHVVWRRGSSRSWVAASSCALQFATPHAAKVKAMMDATRCMCSGGSAGPGLRYRVARGDEPHLVTVRFVQTGIDILPPAAGGVGGGDHAGRGRDADD